MKFDKTIENYIAYHKILCHTEKTITNYIDVVTMFDNVVCPNDYCKICFRDIEKFQKHLTTRNISTATKGTYLRHIKAFVHWLGEYEYISEKELYKRIKIPKMPKKNVKIYSDVEIKQIFESVNVESAWLTARNKLVLSLMLDSGLRQNEVCSIKNKDIDIVGGILNVHGKGNKDRLVPIGILTLKYLKEYQVACPYESEHLLLNRNGKDLTNNAVKVFINKMKKELGFEFSSHKLRHNFATNYLLDHYNKYGYFDTYTLMILLGHEEISTTDRYVHFVKQYIATRQRVSHLDKVFLECEEK